MSKTMNLQTRWQLFSTTPSPATALTISEPKHTLDTVYVTPDNYFTFEAADACSGVFFIAYRIFNSTYYNGLQTYIEPFNLTGLVDRVYTVKFNSTDNLGNVEATNSVQATLFSWNYVYTNSYMVEAQPSKSTFSQIHPSYNTGQRLRHSRSDIQALMW